MIETKSAEVHGPLRSAQKAVLVLGMHRSGTSAFTRVLSLLGLDLPKRLMPPLPDNPRGHWESFELMELHDQALASCGSWWGDWQAIPPEWFGSDDCRRFGDRLMDILRRDFANSTMFVIKDPRICRLAPLWLQTLAQLDIEPLVIITIRHPAEVAASIAIRNGFDPLMSNLLWLRHVLDTESYTRGIMRSFVKFDALMSNWRPTMNKIAEDLQIEWPVAPALAAAAIAGFLSPGDRHHSAHSNCALPAWVAAAYEGLLSEAEENRKRWGPQDWERLSGEVDRATAIFGSLLTNKDRELHVARGQASALSEELQRTAEKVAALQSELEMVQQTAAEKVAAELEMVKQTAAEKVAALHSELEMVQQTAAEKVAALHSELEMVQQTAIQQGNSIVKLTENIRTLKGGLDTARNEILALRNSTSWRITAPIRDIAELLRKIRFQ